MCKVSVIIPSFNHARFLDERFRSVLSQTYQDYEIIFLDDASTDDTRAVFAKYQNHPKVRCFLNATNGGSTFKQWNKGVRAARGEYVWFAESDDAADPTFLETLVALLDRHPDVGLAYTNSVYIDEHGREGTTLDLLFRHLHPTRWTGDYRNRGEDECREYLIFHNTIPNASAAVFRKALYEQVGCADERMKRAGDWWVWAKLLFVSDVAYVAAPLNRYRQEHAQCTRVRRDFHVLLEEMLRVIRLIASRVGFPPGGEGRLCDIYLHHYRWLAGLFGDAGPPTDRRIFELAGDISPRLFFGMVAVARDHQRRRVMPARRGSPTPATPSFRGRGGTLEPRIITTLPAIYHSYRPVEEYLGFLEQAGRAEARQSVVRPVDALALGLLLTLSPARPTLIDLAGDVSGGVSTVLCRGQPRVREVLAVRVPGGKPGWRDALENYLATCADPAALAPCAEVGEDEALRAVKEASAATAPVVLLPAADVAPEELSRKAARWLGLREDVIVVVLALGETGRSEHLASLESSFGGGSPYHLALLRDQTAAFHGCRLGVVYGRGHPHLDGSLARLRQLLTGDFSFLNLAKSVCEAAINAELWEAEKTKAKQTEEALRGQYHEALLEAQRYRHELEQVTGSLAYRLARRLSRTRRLLAPEATARHWALRKLVRAAQVWKTAGLRGLAGQAMKKLVPLRKRAA